MRRSGKASLDLASVSSHLSLRSLSHSSVCDNAGSIGGGARCRIEEDKEWEQRAARSSIKSSAHSLLGVVGALLTMWPVFDVPLAKTRSGSKKALNMRKAKSG